LWKVGRRGPDPDLWLSAARQTIPRLDEDEFAASGLAESDPAAAAQALRALEELDRLASTGFPLLAR
jgi:hypothetical protein